LRLKEAPEPGVEVECPECEHVFPAPDLENGDAPPARPKKRPRDDEDDDDRPATKAGENGAPKKKKKKADPKIPKKRRAKKKETNKTLMILLIVGGIVFLAAVSGLLIWFFSRKPASYEMMKYLPADAEAAVGLNVGHLNKYPEFLKQVEPVYSNNGFKRAADALAKALGTEVNDMLDYMVDGTGKSGSAIVLRTKQEFDQEALAKLPGAKKTGNYYTITNIRGAGDRVFAPTNRIVVFCTSSIPKSTFDAMLTGNEGNEETLALRAGPLSKRVVRGTYWVFGLGQYAKFTAPPKKTDGTSGGERLTYIADVASSAKGLGFKASVGSRSVRFEFVVWCSDSDVAGSKYEKFKGSELAKGDDALEPPRYWKDFAQTGVGGDKKVTTELLSNIGAKTSGELYILYAECDTKTRMASVGNIGGKLAGEQSGGGSGGPPGGDPGGGGGGGGPQALPGPGGGVVLP
jgi:flagellar basal body-associated protein FliL